MELEDTELSEFLEQVVTLRKLPVMEICSKTVREMKLNEGQVMALLKIIMAPEGAFVSTVAEKLYIDTPKASRLVDSLVGAGLVERVYEKLADRRKIQLKATKKGMFLMEKITEETVQTVKELFKDLGEKKKDLTESLTVFNKAMLSKMESMGR
jgi:DNA-binding MarR family transcriptional regulator